MRSLVSARGAYVVVGAVVLALGAVALGAGLRSDTEGGRERRVDHSTQELKSLMTRTAGEPTAADLTQFEAANAGTRAAALARFLRGYRALEAKDNQTALVAFDSSDIGDRTSLGDYALLYEGRALVGVGRGADGARILDRVHEKYPESIVARDASIEAGRAAIAAGDQKAAIDYLQHLVDAGDGEALRMTADVWASRGDAPKAISLYRNAYFYDPASPSATQAGGQLRGLGADPEQSPASEADMRTRANKLYAAQSWAAAADAYGRLLSAYPGGKERDQLLLRRITAAANARDAATAAATFPLVSTSNADAQAEGLYQLATAYRKAGQGAQFESTGARLHASYPKSPWTGRYLGDLVEYLDAKNRLAEMVQVARELIQNFPENDKGAAASYELAWNAYKTKDFQRAADLFVEHLATYRSPATKYVGESAFWGGKAYERLNNVPRALYLYSIAADRYPYGYHGHVAKRRLAEIEQRSPGVKPEQPKAGTPLARARENALFVQPVAETADATVDPRFKRADDFQAIQLWDLAVAELTAAQQSFPTSPRVSLRMAQVFSGRGDNYQATLALRKGYPDVYSYSEQQMPREAWEIMFPLTNWETIKRQAAANNMDPYLVAGLIRQESVFNPKALSRANARGMMQLLPSTGRLVAKTTGLGAIGPADLYNPTVNITLGTSYLAQQYQKFGRIEYAAAAYNAGPGRVVQWKSSLPGDSIEEWVENIPISETRGYVQGVLRYAANYRRFYGKGTERESGQW